MKSNETEELLTAMHRIKRFMQDFHSNQNDCLPQFAFYLLMQIKEQAVLVTLDQQMRRLTRISDLCQSAEVSKPAISRALRDLEEKGYIERINSKRDRRNVYVNLTEPGENVLHRQKEVMDRRTNLFIEKLGETDRSHFTRILNRIPDIMQEVMNETMLKGKDKNE